MKIGQNLVKIWLKCNSLLFWGHIVYLPANNNTSQKAVYSTLL